MNKTNSVLIPLFLSLTIIVSASLAQEEPVNLKAYEDLLSSVGPLPEPDGDHAIIISASSEIKENMGRINTVGEKTMPRLNNLRKARDLYLARAKDSSREEDERLLYRLKALETSVRINLSVLKINQSLQEHYSIIEDQLEKMTNAAHRLDAEFDEASKPTATIEQLTFVTVDKETPHAEIIERIPAGAIPEEAPETFKLPDHLNPTAMDHLLLMEEAASQLPDCSSGFEDLRQIVAQRRATLRLTEEIAKSNLKRIRMIMINGPEIEEHLIQNTPPLTR